MHIGPIDIDLADTLPDELWLKATIPRGAASFIITKLPDAHASTCSGTSHLSHKQASARAIALKVVDKVQQQPKSYSAAGCHEYVAFKRIGLSSGSSDQA
jgi:hypothetical protein